MYTRYLVKLMIQNHTYQNNNKINFGSIIIGSKSLSRLGENVLESGKIVAHKPIRKRQIKLEETKNLYKIHNRIGKYDADIFITGEAGNKTDLEPDFIKIQMKPIENHCKLVNESGRNPLQSVIVYVNSSEITSPKKLAKAIIGKIIETHEQCSYMFGRRTINK